MPPAVPFRRVPADPPHLHVRHAGQAFRVVLRRRPTARRITLRVSNATGEIVLTLPDRADLAAAKRFADAHGEWIAIRLARVPERVAFCHGALVPLRGVLRRIVHQPRGRGVTQATRSTSGERIIIVYGEEPHVARRVQDFLEQEARRDLAKAVEHYTRALAVAAKKVVVRDTRTRWGSCSVKRCLSFSWRLIMAPPFVLDYLAAHEVAHLREMNHSARFWRIVHDICPRTEDAEHWLKHHGTELHRFG